MTSNGKPEYTPTESRILDLLSDGMPHTKDEVRDCLYTESAAFTMHISNIRQKLRRKGHDIICEFANKRTLYRHVILLQPTSAE